MAYMIALYLNIIIFYNTAMLKRTKKTTYWTDKHMTTSTTTIISTTKSIRIENENKRIFLFLNNLNLVTNNYQTFRPEYTPREEVYDGENGFVYHEIENSLKRANSVGITDFLIPESTINVDKLETSQVLEALVNISFSYNITINMLLDQQFLISPKSKNFMSNDSFGSDPPKKIFSKQKKLIFDPSNIRLKFLIRRRIIRFSKCNINNFHFGQNPIYLVPGNNDLDKSEMVEFFDFNLLHERAEYILKISKRIKLFYYYNFVPEKDYLDLFRFNLKGLNYEGSLINTVWDPFYITIVPETHLTFIFQKSKTEKKVITFYLKIINDSVEYLDVVLGIYLFSPVSIIFAIQSKYAFPIYNNILTNQLLLKHQIYAKINNAYLWVLKIIRENSFFQNNPILLENVKLNDNVISAISGTKDNGKISGLLFLLYNRQDKHFNIDLNEHFLGWSFQTYSILYDSVPEVKSYLMNQSGEIYLTRQQILIIQPNLLF